MTLRYSGPLWDGPRAGAHIERAARRTVEDMLRQARVETPVDTGLLQRSWDARLEGKHLVLENMTPYAQWVRLKGTRERWAPKVLRSVTGSAERYFAKHLKEWL